jgi:holo-[acyl-carrier protein] synthase
MRIAGHGIDLVEVDRIARMIADHGEHFLSRCFTAAEREHGAGSKREAEHLAARFAAKEAALKALGTGLTHGISWTDIEVIRHPSGQPTIRLRGEAAAIAARLGIGQWHLSLSHTATHAIASVIAVADEALP